MVASPGTMVASPGTMVASSGTMVASSGSLFTFSSLCISRTLKPTMVPAAITILLEDWFRQVKCYCVSIHIIILFLILFALFSFRNVTYFLLLFIH